MSAPAVTVVMASGGYPDKYEVGKRISGLGGCCLRRTCKFSQAGTAGKNGAVVTNGGRVVAVTALGENRGGRPHRAPYEAVSKIDFRGSPLSPRYLLYSALSANIVGH